MPMLTLPIGEVDDSCTLVPEDQPGRLAAELGRFADDVPAG